MAFNKRYILPILIAFGLSLPQGLTSIFLPSVKVSSIYDGNDVRLAVLSLQTIFIFLYVLIFIERIRIDWREAILAIILLYFGFVGAFFSLSPGGYMSYSLLWCIFPFAVSLHSQSFKDPYASDDLIEDISLIGIVFLPFYLIDLALSIVYLGFESFSSFMLASNGHSFVSFLFSLALFIKLPSISKNKINYKLSCLFIALIYLGGGVISAGRVGLFAFTLCFLIKSPVKVVAAIIISSPIALFFMKSIDKYNAIVEILFIEGLDDIRIWSSGISRLNFWYSHFDIFLANFLAGAGGLATNIVKYNYNFQYDVFVDPHNELIFILSGFGLFGIGFVIVSLTLALCFSRVFRNCIPKKKFASLNSWLIILYLTICSITNANSAKQNIQLLFIFILMMAFFSIAVSKKFKRN